MSRYAYSYDREDFTGSYETHEAAFADAVRKMEGLTNPPTSIYIGTIVEADPQASDHATAIIESMNRRAHVDYGDSARKYLANVTPEQVHDLDVALEQTLRAWLQKYNLLPTFVRIAGVREYPVPVPEGAPLPGENDEVTEIGTSNEF